MIEKTDFVREAQEMLGGLYRLSMSILRSREDAQDAVQQALLRAWERRAQAREATFRGWLTRIVINECRNIQRRRMRVIPMDELPERPCRGPESGGELAMAMDALPEKLRTPLLLRYMTGFSEKEIAQALGITQPAVKSRLHRARRALREQLGDSEVTFE